jgi:hypothetical protein
VKTRNQSIHLFRPLPANQSKKWLVESDPARAAPARNNPGYTTNEWGAIICKQNQKYRFFNSIRCNNWVRDAAIAGSNPATPTPRARFLSGQAFA